MAAVEPILTLDELQSLIDASYRRPVWVFKHSLTCGVSSAALHEFQTFVGEQPEESEAIYGLIEIQSAPGVSTALSERTGVSHESPQTLLLQAGASVWYASHWDITREALGRAAERSARSSADA